MLLKPAETAPGDRPRRQPPRLDPRTEDWRAARSSVYEIVYARILSAGGLSFVCSSIRRLLCSEDLRPASAGVSWTLVPGPNPSIGSTDSRVVGKVSRCRSPPGTLAPNESSVRAR